MVSHGSAACAQQITHFHHAQLSRASLCCKAISYTRDPSVIRRRGDHARDTGRLSRGRAAAPSFATATAPPVRLPAGRTRPGRAPHGRTPAAAPRAARGATGPAPRAGAGTGGQGTGHGATPPAARAGAAGEGGAVLLRAAAARPGAGGRRGQAPASRLRRKVEQAGQGRPGNGPVPRAGDQPAHVAGAEGNAPGAGPGFPGACTPSCGPDAPRPDVARPETDRPPRAARGATGPAST